ncbi:NADPH-dependent FMN reductase [Actinocrispum sp. NPDC049592]|uniref:NADPH-dependent FMN reductase n=1 Tax=Actinocrispum sp. NPDC049592 TaxID=3154835 RepID=UPI00343470F4
MTYQVGYLVGSPSGQSAEHRLARAFARLAPHADLQLTELPITDLPLYTRDGEEAVPPAAATLKQAVTSSDGMLFVTPEYNRTIPAALKNAIDWTAGELDGKPSAIAATGSTEAAQRHLRDILTVTNSPVLDQPVAELRAFTEEGEPGDDTSADFLIAYLSAFRDLIKRKVG